MGKGKVTIKNGGKQKVLEEITLKEAKKMKVLGAGAGTDLYHCVYLGMNHGLNFFERVKYYRFISKKEFYSQVGSLCEEAENLPAYVEFYE